MNHIIANIFITLSCFLSFIPKQKKWMHVMFIFLNMYTQTTTKLQSAGCSSFQTNCEIQSSQQQEKIFMHFYHLTYITPPIQFWILPNTLTTEVRYADVKISIEAREKAQKVFFSYFLFMCLIEFPRVLSSAIHLEYFLSLFGYICTLYAP